MKKRTPRRPALLQKTIALDNIRDHTAIEATGMLATLSRLAALWEGLDAVRSTRDPLVTKEAAALKYRSAFDKATAVAVVEVRATAKRLIAAEERLRHDARGKAGLLADYPDSKELRDVLRSMSQADRDAAITHAAEVGDHAVIAALQAHELLVGATSRPIASIINDFVAARAPEEMAKIADLETAAQHLELAYGSFKNSVEGMRDLEAEREGDEGVKAAKEAEAKLGLALSESAA